MTVGFSKRRVALLFGYSLAVACGPVAKSDPDFWDPADDVGGKSLDFSNGGGAPPIGGGGAPSYGGAVPPPPPGSGGWANPGSGGSGNSTGAVGNDTGGANWGSGGYVNPGSGGYVNPGSGGSDPGAGGVPPTDNPQQCTFTFTVTTVTARGRFAPRNVGALWIENQSGGFVKSLEVWGAQRLPNLTAWTSVSGNNTVDAVTSATLSNHRQHTGHWNCTDVNRQAVQNGNYQACVSFAEDDAIPFFGPAPHVACAPFQRGVGPFSQNPPDAANFTGWSLVMQ